MTPPVNNNALNQPFTGWDELRAGGTAPSWRIERTAPAAPVARDAVPPFFPEQNGKVHETMLANLPVMLHAMNPTGHILTVNRRWSQSLGYTLAEVQGRSFNDLLTPESRARLVQAIYPSYLANGVCRGELLTIVRAGGATVQVLLSMTAYRGDKGKVERSICLLEEPVSVSVPAPVNVVEDQRFKGAFESAGHGMALVSALGEITLANEAFWDFLRMSEDRRQRVSLDSLVHADDREAFLAAMGRLISGSVPAIKQDFRYAAGDGATAHGMTSVALLRTAKGEVEQIIVQIVDIGERKQAARQLQQAQKMEAIGQLTGGLAHDFNNLLTVVIGNLELLEGKFSGDERAGRRLKEAIDAARKGSDLTRQMLAFARKQALEPREVKINELVNGMAPLVSRSIGETIQVKVVPMAGEPMAVIDPSQLESAILNLAINARDAMAGGGLLTIETQASYLDEAYAARHPEVVPGHYVMVAVSDTGSGMSPELLEKVFQPFFTTKEQGKGSGLGLSMVYGFIKQSGGHISVYSEVGHGTAIKMYLPRKFAPGETVPAVEGVAPESVMPVERETPAPVAAQPVEPEVPAGPRAPRILVVEDQEAVRAVACGFLQDFGYDVIEAEDGLQALSRLQENPDIDLMFSDVVMPGALNGFDLAQAARGIRPDLKIVHTSGYPKGAMVH